MRSGRIELRTVGITHMGHISGIFNNGNLHTETDPKIRNGIGPGTFDGSDHTLGSSLTESSGHQHRIHLRKGQARVTDGLESLGIEILDAYANAVTDACMHQGLRE